MRSEGDTVFYLITLLEETVKFQDVLEEEMYNNSRAGFMRKAIMGKQSFNQTNKRYKDPFFQIPPSKEYFLTRLYDMYDQDIDIFPDHQTQSSFIQKQQRYCSAMGESSIISFGYLRTLLLTQKITKIGKIQYFVKRQGEYYLQTCDDIIPVDRKTWNPLWGISLKHPWQLVLLKIWLKQCGGWENIWKASPFQLLDAFGLPTYTVYNFRKQVRFLKEQHLPIQKKSQNIVKCPLNNTRAIIIAKTADSPRLNKVGLVPNQAAFRLMQYDSFHRSEQQQEEPTYRVFSGLPCNWVGEKTAVTKTQLNQTYAQEEIDLQRSFMMLQQQVLNYFDKFYAAPCELCVPDLFQVQDCLNLSSNGRDQIWLEFECKNMEEGLISITVELPKNAKKSDGKYPDIRFVLAKKNSLNQIKASHLRPSHLSQNQKQGSKGILYGDSNCDKWQHYAIEFMQGYHFNTTSFSKVSSGQYIIYIHINQQTHFNLRIDSHVEMNKPELIELPNQKIRQIFQSVFFQISEDMGVNLNLSRTKVPLESISINDNFEQLGFGSIAIKTLEKADFQIAMRVYPDKLFKYGIEILKCYKELITQINGQPVLTIKSQSGRPEVLVMERTNDRRRQSRIKAEFPPPGTIQFFKVFPKQENYYR